VKVELAKETALTSQQNEFLKRRIDELKKQNEELAVKFEDTISKISLPIY
jgi:chaperonin cofactor prefoldin